MRENNVQRRAWLALAKLSRVFRVNTGRAWLSGAGPVQRLTDGSVVVPAARPVALGLGMPDGKPLVGTSDLLGWTSVTITPDLVGCRVAVFTAIETKESGGGHQRPEQKNFIDQVRLAGGIAGFASSPEEAVAVVEGFQPPLLLKKDVGSS
jgi:hypothetical protein